MKITKRQLRRIIKEAIGRAMGGGRVSWGDIQRQFPKAAASLQKNVVSYTQGDDYDMDFMPGDRAPTAQDILSQSEFFIAPDGSPVHYWDDPQSPMNLGSDAFLIWDGMYWVVPETPAEQDMVYDLR